jgi:hypothetical protein
MKLKKFILALTLLFLATGCEGLRQRDYNNWGVPEDSRNGARWNWTP